jgi:phospholipase C
MLAFVHGWRRPALACCLLLTLLMAPAGGSLSARAAATGLEGIPGLSHVFVIVLENKSYDETWGSASPARYLNSLRAKGTLLSQYYGAGHASNDNYISMTSGQPPNPDTMGDCINWESCVQAVSSPAFGGGISLPDQLEATGHSWKGYMESMPAACTHAASNSTSDPYQGDSTQPPGGEYADRHNPFIYYAPIVNNLARCRAHVVPFSALSSDLSSGAVPNFSFIVPNTCDDGHDAPCADGRPGGLVTADAWLKAHVPSLLSYTMSHNGLLVITFDEAENNDTSGCCGAGPGGTHGFGGRIGLLAISPHVAQGAVDVTSYDHPSLLRTLEDAFGIESYLNNAGLPTEHAMSDLFIR